jgi:hypothetical protein
MHIFTRSNLLQPTSSRSRQKIGTSIFNSTSRLTQVNFGMNQPHSQDSGMLPSPGFLKKITSIKHWKSGFKVGLQGVKQDLSQNWGKHLLISSLITLLTCWLPGSQLVTIPLWFCMSAAIEGGRGFYTGFNNPDDLSNKQSETEAQ